MFGQDQDKQLEANWLAGVRRFIYGALVSLADIRLCGMS